MYAGMGPEPRPDLTYATYGPVSKLNYYGVHFFPEAFYLRVNRYLLREPFRAIFAQTPPLQLPVAKPLDTHTSQDSSTCLLDIPEHSVAM